MIFEVWAHPPSTERMMIRWLNLLRQDAFVRTVARISHVAYSDYSSVRFACLTACVLSLVTIAPATSEDFYLGTAPSGGDGTRGSSGVQTLTIPLQDGCDFSRGVQAPRPASARPLAPKLFNSSRHAHRGDIIFLQGANLTPSTRVFLDAPGGASSEIPIVNRVEPNWIATQIPSNMSGAFQVRAVNDDGSSSAIRINAPVPYHLDTTQIVPGGHFRIFGRNLLYATCRPKVAVGGYPADVDTTASRDYMLVVRAPPGITPSETADVLVDNGAGLGPSALDGGVRVVAGVGDPFKLNTGWAASFDFAARVVTSSAACDGRTDDTALIKKAISSARELGGAIVQLPKGTCRIAGTIDFESKVVLRGAGRNDTILRYEGNYPISVDSKDLVGLEDLQLLNAGATQEGMLWRANTRSFIRHVTINMGISRQWFLTDNRDFLFDDNHVIQTGSYDLQNPYRFDRSVGLLFSNNRSTNVNGSPTFQSVHDSAFINNRFTRDATSQDEITVVAHHGFVLDFAQRVSVIGNTFDVVNGPITNKQRNDGETILIEGGGPNRTESLGVVKTAGANFLSDPENPLIAALADRKRLNLGIAIVSGNGTGQTRQVVEEKDGMVSVDPPWDVLPEVGSHYVIFVWGLDKVLIIGNTLVDNPRGIWLYQTSIRDVVIQSNEIRNGGGIYLRSYQNIASKIFTIQLNTVIEDNRVANRTGNWMSHIILVCVSADETTFGVGQLGIEVRRNMILANLPNLTSAREEYAAHEGYAAMVRIEASQPPPGFLPKLIGPIFQDNTCVNCERPFTVGAGVAGAIFFGNVAKPTNGLSVVRDIDIADRPVGGSIATVIR
jgi:Pectate lyase superfamily protein